MVFSSKFRVCHSQLLFSDERTLSFYVCVDDIVFTKSNPPSFLVFLCVLKTVAENTVGHLQKQIKNEIKQPFSDARSILCLLVPMITICSVGWKFYESRASE